MFFSKSTRSTCTSDLQGIYRQYLLALPWRLACGARHGCTGSGPRKLPSPQATGGPDMNEGELFRAKGIMSVKSFVHMFCVCHLMIRK